MHGLKAKRERKEGEDVGIICVIIYDDLALEAWTHGERESEREKRPRYVCALTCVCVSMYVCVGERCVEYGEYGEGCDKDVVREKE